MQQPDAATVAAEIKQLQEEKEKIVYPPSTKEDRITIEYDVPLPDIRSYKMSNLSAYPSYSSDFLYPVPVGNYEASVSTNHNIYPLVLQILAQLRTAQSEWNVWKTVSMSLQSSLQREQQLRLQDKFKFHLQDQQMFNQIESLRSQLDQTTEALNLEKEQSKRNLSLCKDANLQTPSSMQDLEYLNEKIHVLKENVLNLTKVIEKKDETLVKKEEESQINQEKLKEALQMIEYKDVQLEDIRDERKVLNRSLELTEEAIRNLKSQEREDKTILEQILNVTEVNIVREVQLNELRMQLDECRTSSTNSKNKSKEEKNEIGEGLNTLKEEIGKLKAQEEENQAKFQKVLAENHSNMTTILTKQTQLNDELVNQKDELKKSLEDLKNKSEREKRELHEGLNKFKEEIMKFKTEERESQSKLQVVLEEKLNMVDTLTKQVKLIEELRKQKEELQATLADLKQKSEGEKHVINEELRICKETTKPVIGPCGPAQLKEITMPPPEEGMYKTGLKKNMVPGCVIQVIGSFKSTGDTPSINLDFPHGIALHIVFRFKSGHICRNTFTNGKWGPEETGGGMPVQLGQKFNVTITSTAENFQICINGVMFATYKHRIEKTLITGIWIAGPLQLQKVAYFAPTNV